MRKILQAASVLLVLGACHTKKPEPAASSTPLKLADTSPDEKPFQAFSILIHDPMNFVFSPPLSNQAISNSSKPDPSIHTFKWKKTDSKKSEAEISKWLGTLGCGDSSAPELTDFKKNKVIQFGSKCFQSAFKFFFTPETDLMKFRSSPYQASWAKSMKLDQRLPFHETEYFQYLELPLNSESFQMVLMLPKKELTLQESVKILTKSNFQSALSQLKDKRIVLKLPAFSVNKPLFAKKAILLSGMESFFNSSNAPAEVLLYFPFKFNEFGINQDSPSKPEEAVSQDIRLEFYKTLEFNRPFYFALRNKTDQEIVALGKVYAP